MSELTGVVLDFEGVDFIDSQGSKKLDEILELAHQAGATLRLARLKPGVRDVLVRDGVFDRIGEDRIHGNVHQAVEFQRVAWRAVVRTSQKASDDLTGVIGTLR